MQRSIHRAHRAVQPHRVGDSPLPDTSGSTYYSRLPSSLTNVLGRGAARRGVACHVIDPVVRIGLAARNHSQDAVRTVDAKISYILISLLKPLFISKKSVYTLLPTPFTLISTPPHPNLSYPTTPPFSGLHPTLNPTSMNPTTSTPPSFIPTVQHSPLPRTTQPTTPLLTR